MIKRTATTPWCKRMPSSPRGLHWYTEGKPGYQKFWFCHEGLKQFGFDYDTAKLRLIISNTPFAGCEAATFSDETSSNIDHMLSHELSLYEGDSVFWAPELFEEKNGEEENDNQE